MSTIRHPVQNHTWWYATAAAVVLAGVLAVLLTSVLTNSGSIAPTTPAPPIGADTHTKAYRVPCFAGHPGASIELVRSSCR